MPICPGASVWKSRWVWGGGEGRNAGKKKAGAGTCFYPKWKLPFKTVIQWSRPIMWSNSKDKHQEKFKSTQSMHCIYCSLIPACSLLFSCIPHLAVGTPAPNLSSSVKSSRKFGLLPPWSPALGRSHFMAPVTPSAHFLLGRWYLCP